MIDHSKTEVTISIGKKGGGSVNSPAKRKGRGSDVDDGGKSGSEADGKRKRTDSNSRNLHDEDDCDSEKDTKGGNESDKDSATSSMKGSKEDKDDFFLPKDKEEEKYIPPPPLPYAIMCPKPGCKKRYRQHNGLRFHVSSAHPELLDEVGNIKDTSEIEKMEKEAKERLGVIDDDNEETDDKKATTDKASAEGVASAIDTNGKTTTSSEKMQNNDGSTDCTSNSGSSSKTSTPGPNEMKTDTPPSSALNLPPGGAPPPTSSSSDAPVPPPTAAAVAAAITVPLPPTPLKGVQGLPLDAKPIPVSAIEGGIPTNARPPPPVLQTTLAGAVPLVTSRPQQQQPQPLVNPIRPPANPRPIVPATGPQIVPGLGPAGMNLKPIQPRPAIMPDPAPNMALDDLKKAKKYPKSNSPGNSPPRNNVSVPPPAGILGAQPPGSGIPSKTKLDNQIHHQNTVNNPGDQPVKSPAQYSDISDDEGGDRNKKDLTTQRQPGLPPPTVQRPSSQPAPPPPLNVPMSAPPTSVVPPQAAPPPVGAGPPGGLPGSPGGQLRGQAPYNFPPFGLPPTASLPTVPVLPQQAAAQAAQAAQAAAAKEKKDIISGPQPGTIEYEKMLLAYGFPPFPYPIPAGMDPSMHMHMLTTDPAYKAKYDKDRAEKEKAFKEQIDRDNREKDRKAGVKHPPPLPMLEQPSQQSMLQPPSQQSPFSSVIKAEQKQPTSVSALAAQSQQKPAHSSQHSSSPMISVKPEFRQDTKKEHHPGHRDIKADPHPTPPAKAAPTVKKAEDEGIKATMETRGPPPATPTSFASLMHPALMGRNPLAGYDPAMLAGLPPHILASLYANPYAAAAMAQAHLPGQIRPPGMPGMPSTSQSPEDLSRNAAMAMAALSQMPGGGSSSSATKALDLLAQQANQYYAAVAASAGQGVTTTTSSLASPSSNSQIHKIHELQERALKSPVTNRSTGSPSINLSQSSLSRGATPTSMLTSTVPTTSTTTKSCTSDLRTPSPSSRATPTGARSRSPPPLRHVHTHTHTHFGLGYPMLSPSHPLGIPGVGPAGPPAAPPAAHTPFPPPGFASHLLPGKPSMPGAPPNFPPPK